MKTLYTGTVRPTMRRHRQWQICAALINRSAFLIVQPFTPSQEGDEMQEKINATIRNAQALSEKGRQVEPGNLEAFGIAISSRHCKAKEIIELLRFATEAANACVAHYVKSAFYDSVSCCCSFELDPAVTYGDDIERELRSVADKTISQFDWFNSVRGNDNFADE